MCWPRSFDVLLLTASDRRDALLEFFNGFDFVLFLHFLNFDLKPGNGRTIVPSGNQNDSSAILSAGKGIPVERYDRYSL